MRSLLALSLVFALAACGDGSGGGGSGGDSDQNQQTDTDTTDNDPSGDGGDTTPDDESCTEDAVRCGGADGRDSEVCHSGAWERFTTCPQACVNGECVAYDCAPGSTQCCYHTTDDQRHCSAAVQNKSYCVGGDGDCPGIEVNATTTIYIDAVFTETCNANGQWSANTPCAPCGDAMKAPNASCAICESGDAAQCAPACEDLCGG